jgi:hypothetical protein
MAKIYGYEGTRLAVVGANALAVPFTGAKPISPAGGQKVKVSFSLVNRGTGPLPAGSQILVKGYRISGGATLPAESTPDPNLTTGKQLTGGYIHGIWTRDVNNTQPHFSVTRSVPLNPGNGISVTMYSGPAAYQHELADKPSVLDVIFRVFVNNNFVAEYVGRGDIVVPVGAPKITISSVDYSIA